MPLSVRMDEETRKVLDRIARSKGIARSEVIRRGIRLVAEQEGIGTVTPAIEQIRHLVGSVGGGPSDLSSKTGERFRELISSRRKRAK